MKKEVLTKISSKVVGLVESLPGATATPCGNTHFAFEVSGRKFGYLLRDHHGDGRIAINCKAVRGMNEELAKTAPDRFHVPKYVGHHGWIGLWLDVPGVEWTEIECLVVAAYLLVAPKRLSADMA